MLELWASVTGIVTAGGAAAPMQQLAHWLHLPCGLAGWDSSPPQWDSACAVWSAAWWDDMPAWRAPS
ncbi:hypothetical protein FHW83_004211 [Duganella sp. SG902]|uniref:hypothetical protein n=1 Tax=Duganella sp. SG902 TaxID=2587016 RepID=UPI00159E2721|nr:hypothetical protein [Duganella sp. SG902]NVM78383.1 hypothetical protein [Duganella sp. SG902]